MKLYNFIPTCLLFLFIIGCEKTMIEKESSFSDQEVLISEISSELDLSSSQENIVREKLRESKEFHAHPSSLWRLAASLYEILSEDQTKDLLSNTKQGTFHDHAFNSEPEHEPKHEKFFDFKINLFNKIMNESQSESFDLLIETFNIKKDSLGIKWKNNEIDVNEFKSNIFSLKNYFKVSIERIMTLEQIEELDSKIYDIKTSKKDFGIHAQKTERLKEEKLNALEITEDQLILIGQLDLKFKINLDILNLDFTNNNPSKELFIQNVANLIQIKQLETFQILTEKQNTIIKIHHALTIKAHKKYSYTQKG